METPHAQHGRRGRQPKKGRFSASGNPEYPQGKPPGSTEEPERDAISGKAGQWRYLPSRRIYNDQRRHSNTPGTRPPYRISNRVVSGGILHLGHIRNAHRRFQPSRERSGSYGHLLIEGPIHSRRSPPRGDQPDEQINKYANPLGALHRWENSIHAMFRPPRIDSMRPSRRPEPKANGRPIRIQRDPGLSPPNMNSRA